MDHSSKSVLKANYDTEVAVEPLENQNSIFKKN